MRSSLPIALLICLGIGLLGSIHFVERTLPGAAPAQRGRGAGIAREGEPRRLAPIQKPLANALPNTDPAITWRELEANDSRRLIANLRAVSCPEVTIRDIVLSRVDALFSEEESRVRFKLEGPAKAWGSRPNLTDADLERARQWRAVQLEKRALLRDLLGIDMPLDILPSTHTRNYEDFQVALSALPETKRDRVQEMKEKYWQASDALKASYTGRPRSEYVEAYRDLNARHQDELARVLSARELDEFLIRTSVTGTGLATRLADFGASEEEFRAIFHIVRGYEEETGRVGGQYGMAEVDGETGKAALEARFEQLRSALGEARFEEYERCQDETYRNLAWVAGRHGLPREAALQAYELEKTHEEDRRQIQAELDSRSATPAEREAALSHMAAELQTAQAEILGKEAAKLYRRLFAAGK